MARELTMKELVWFIERLGRELDWSTRYMDLAATATGAVFRSLDLDESSDVLPIGKHASEMQLETLESDLSRRGLTPSTITTYVTTWRRVSTVADGWVTALEASSEAEFWDKVDGYRDTRQSRRHRTEDKSTASSKRQQTSDDLDTSDDANEPWKRFEIPLDDGVAVVELPRKLSQAEAFQIIEALFSAGAVNRTTD